MKKIFFFILAGASLNASAQQLQNSSLFDLQGVLQNPSMAGALQKGTIGASYRSQWNGVSGRPQTVTVFGSFDLSEQKIALGGHLFSDQTGPLRRNGIQAAFAKYIPMQNGARISLGIEARMTQYVIDVQKLSETLGSDPVLQGGTQKAKFDAGFGVSYVSPKFYVGASVSQLVQSKLGFYEGSLPTTEQARLYRHFYFHGAYNFKVDEDNVITPYFLVTYLPNAPTEVQLGARLTYKELVFFGLGTRIRQRFTAQAGLHVSKKLTFAYGFDMYRTPYSVFESGANAHEIMIRFNRQ